MFEHTDKSCKVYLVSDGLADCLIGTDVLQRYSLEGRNQKVSNKGMF